jgi:hypothetical protein
MTRHVGAETLARYHEGDLSDRKSARIRAHLAGCARCSALNEDLAAVAALLASAPAPVMPDQVTARIQAALMAEAARTIPASAGHQPGRSDAAGEPGRRMPSRHATRLDAAPRRWHLPDLRSQPGMRVLGAAAAAVVIAGGIYGAVQLVSGNLPETSSGRSSAAAPEQQAVGRPLQYRLGGRAASFTPVSTGTNFRPGQLAAQMGGLLRSAAPNVHANKRPAAAGPSSLPSHRAAPAAGAGARSFSGIAVSELQGCVTRISAGRPVKLVDVALYRGSRATVIVVAGRSGSSQIYVVGPGCSRSASHVIAHASLPGAG